MTQSYTCNRGLERGDVKTLVNHKIKPLAETEENSTPDTFPNEEITEDDFKTFLTALSDGASFLTACQHARIAQTTTRTYIKRSGQRRKRVMRARADWKMFHLRRLKKDNDDASGSSSRVRASLGALASVDKRFRKDVHVGATINNTLVLADPRPPSTIGNPDRYAIAQADAKVIDTPSPELKEPKPTAPTPPSKKGTPII